MFSTQPKVDKALLMWFRPNLCQAEVRIDGTMLVQQANAFIKERLTNSFTEQMILMAWIDR